MHVDLRRLRRLLALLVLGSLCLLPLRGHSDMVCDGIDDIATSAALTNALITTTTGTVFLTLRHAGSPQGGGLCARDQLWTYTGSENVALLADDAPVWVAKNFDGTQDCASGTFTTAWTTLVWRHGGGTLELFVNGTLAQSVASGTTSGTLGTTATLCWNGTQVDGPAPITVAQVAFYATSVADDQIAAYANSFIRGLVPSGATAVWDFQDCAHGGSVDAQVFPDRTGNGRTITADNGANNTGMSCAGSTGMVLMGGIQ